MIGVLTVMNISMWCSTRATCEHVYCAQLFLVMIIWVWSRRAAAGRAQLLAKKGHTGRVQNPVKVSENRPACGTAQHTLAVCFVFEKFWKNTEKIWLKFGENSAKFSQNLRNFGKKQQQFQQFLTKILRLASGAKECIV